MRRGSAAFLLIGSFAVFLTALLAPPPPSEAGPGTAPASRKNPEEFDHSPYDRLLRTYVRDGLVDYAAFTPADRKVLGDYLAVVAEADTSKIRDKDGRFAFFVNAYNALVIREVLAHPGVGSVKEIPGFFDGTRHRVGRRSVTLDELERKVIWPSFLEARYHFVLVCGARGCPALPSAALTTANQDSILAGALSRFARDPAKLRFDRAAITFHASPLFQWYGKDFEPKYQSVQKLVMGYLELGDVMALSGKTAKFEYGEYDWSLNQAAPSEGTGPR